jgi:hypothetical protein
MLRCAPPKVSQPCHSEEQSDDESASEDEEKQMLRCAQHDSGGTFISIGGPKARVTLNITPTPFHQPATANIQLN